MLRQPQLHSSTSRAHVHVCAPHYLLSPTYPLQMLIYTLTHIHSPTVATGDRGVSARVWRALPQVVPENDGSWQHTVWHPPKSAPPPLPNPPCSPSLSIPPSLLTLSNACRLWPNNSASTCLSSTTFMKITAACVFLFGTLMSRFLWLFLHTLFGKYK